MAIPKIKKTSGGSGKARFGIEIDKFTVRVSGGYHEAGGKPRLTFTGVQFDAVPSRQTRVVTVYLGSDGRLHRSDVIVGRPADLPRRVKLVDKILWFEVDPRAKSLAKTTFWTKGYISLVGIDDPDDGDVTKDERAEGRVVAEAAEAEGEAVIGTVLAAIAEQFDGEFSVNDAGVLVINGEATDVTLADLSDADDEAVAAEIARIVELLSEDDDDPAALYDPVELESLNDKQLVALAKTHGSKLTNRKKVINFLSGLDKSDAIAE